MPLSAWFNLFSPRYRSSQCNTSIIRHIMQGKSSPPPSTVSLSNPSPWLPHVFTKMEQLQPGSRALEELDLLQKPLDPAPAKRRNAFSYWKLKLLIFLDGIRRQRAHCVVCLQVHQIDGLPPAMDGRVLVVSWKTKGCKGEHTLPVHACQGIASFDEIFLHYCSSDVQAALKNFTIWASLVDAADCDLGTFHVDLSELPAADDSNSGFGGKTMGFVLGGLAAGGALRLSVYCRTMEEEGHALIGKSKGKKSKCFSCLPDLGCLRTSPVTFCARRIPSLRSDHGFITIENSVTECPPTTDEDGGFITIEKEKTVGSRPRGPPSDHMANTDDDESGGPEDENPCLAIEEEDEGDDGDGVEDEFLRMLEEKYYCKGKDGDEEAAKKKGGVGRSLSLSLSLDMSADLDLESLVKEAEMELAKAMRVWRSRAEAALMEEEYEELMRRWGELNGGGLMSSSSSSGWHGIHGFGSPV